MLPRAYFYMVSLALLVGITGERLCLLPSKSAKAFHERVKAQALKVPLSFGTWVGKDVPVDNASVGLLKRNVLISRDYHNISTGRHVGFLFDQCPDARAIADHYPPICYVNQGYSRLSAEPRDWQMPGLNVTGIEYLFSRSGLSSTSTVYVQNFIEMPDVRIVLDMGAAKPAASNRRRPFFGAAQVE